MGGRVFPVLLAIVAAILDGHGSHGLARDALLAAVPFAAVAALLAFGEYLEAREDAVVGLQALLWGAAVAYLYVSGGDAMTALSVMAVFGVGVATLVIFPIPTAWRAWIEDVIVDESTAGRGIGTALTEAMLEHSRAAGCKTVDLTSRPKREAANHMYRKLGFVQRDTNVYRMVLGAQDTGED